MGLSLTTGSGGVIGPESDHGQRRGQGATPAACYLGLCRLRGILSPPASAMVILQAGNSYLSQRWRCRRAVLSCSSDGAAAIPKSGLEIQNHCTLEVVSGQKPAAIPKSGPEIKNRCSSKPVLEAGHSSLLQGKLESAAELFAAMPAAGGPFSFAATRIESAAEVVAATATAGETILCCRKEN